MQQTYSLINTPDTPTRDGHATERHTTPDLTSHTGPHPPPPPDTWQVLPDTLLITLSRSHFPLHISPESVSPHKQTGTAFLRFGTQNRALITPPGQAHSDKRYPRLQLTRRRISRRTNPTVTI
ncbi:unnamed protein product [Ixodes hexagonus]